MATTSYDEVLGLVEQTTEAITGGSFARNDRDANSALDALRKKYTEVNGYEDKVKEVVGQSTEADKARNLQQSYDSLKFLFERKIRCLETLAQITSLEDNISGLSQFLDLKTSSLVHPGDLHPDTKEKSGHNLPGFISRTAQDCINGVHDNWNWILALIKCVEIHQINGMAYHEFFHEVEESEPWMLEELRQILVYFETKVTGGGENEAKKLAAELESIYLTLRQWEAKTCRLWESATRLVPVPLRTTPNTEPLPARAICDYESKAIHVRTNEDIVLLDSSKPKLWKIKNGKGQEGEVPAPVVLIPGPDDQAIKASLRLRLQLLTSWTNALKIIGKRIIYFLLIIFKAEYSSEEISALRSMDEMEKENLLSLLTYIEEAFKRYWSDHEGFLSVQERILVLRMILQQPGDGDTSNEELYKQLIILITTIHQATTVYQSISDEWEKFKAVLEASRSPELMLILDKWEQLQFVSKDYFSKFWQNSLFFDETDSSSSFGELDNFFEEQSEFGVAKERKIAEAEHLSLAEIQERKSFHIKSVVNPANQKEISLQEAIMLGVIRPDDGVYVNTVTGETIPIAVAMGNGQIKVSFSVTRSSEEKTSSIGIITIKTIREGIQPFTILWVKDTETGEELTPDEAVKRGILKEAQGYYIDRKTGKKSLITEAADSKLINIEYFGDKPEPEVISKSYAVRAVVDRKQKKTVTFKEALQIGILDRDSGAFVNNLTGEKIDVDEAIIRGFLKARIIDDPTSLNIDPENRIFIEKVQIIRRKVIKPLKVIGAFKMAAKN